MNLRDAQLSLTDLQDRARQTSFLVPGLAITVVDARTAEVTEATRIELPADVIADDRPTFWITLCLMGVTGAVLAHWSLRR